MTTNRIFLCVLILAVLWIIRLIYNRKRKLDKVRFVPQEGTDYLDDLLYQKKFSDELPSSNKSTLDRINRSLDSLSKLIESEGNLLESTYEDSWKRILDNIELSETLIAKCWNDTQFNTNYYSCLSLHFASHKLSNLIKSEQIKVRNNFVSIDANVNKIGFQIDHLNEVIPNRKGQEKYSLEMEHQQLCKRHQRLCKLKGNIGGINSLYHERLKKQLILTGNRRDYIISHFGNRGREWGRRLKERKDMLKSVENLLQ